MSGIFSLKQTELIREVSIFRAASDETLLQIARLCRWQRHDSASAILSYQDRSTDVFFILQGRARAVIYSLDGKALLFTDIKQGDVFGEIAAIDRGPRSASVEALEPTLVAAMTAPDFERVLRLDAEVAIAALRLLTARVRHLSDRVYEFRTLGVQARVQAELLRLAAGMGVSRGAALLSPAPSLADIADRVSTHREAVSRELSRLAARGLISRVGSAIRIADVAQLAELLREARGE
jgi:CRP-like cAMP-binding protein